MGRGFDPENAQYLDAFVNPQPLLHEAHRILDSDAMPYGQVVAAHTQILEQLTEADMNQGDTSEMLARKAELQAKNPGAFRHLSAIAIEDTL